MLKFFNSDKLNEELSAEFRYKLIDDSGKRLMFLIGIIGLSQILFIIFEMFSSNAWDKKLFIIRIALIAFCLLSSGTIYLLRRIKKNKKSIFALSILITAIQFISLLTGCYFVIYMFNANIYSYSAFYLVIFIISLTNIQYPFYPNATIIILLICTTIYLSIFYSPMSSWLGEFLIALVITPVLCVFNILNYNRISKHFLQDKEMENNVSKLALQLSQKHKLESIGELASGVAHEINNPINGVLNYSQIILDSDLDDKSIKGYAKEIITETERVAEIVKNLLEFSRQNHLEKEYTRIEDIISKTLSLISVVIKNDQISLNVNIAKNMPLIKCNSQHIEQVLMNLVTNARDALNELYIGYNENKIINITCSHYNSNRREWLRIVVEDFGGGISKDSMPKIFDPFFSTKGRLNGTGLGLSISYGIIKDHHGEITVESEEGKYTRVTVTLPCDNGWDLETKNN